MSGKGGPRGRSNLKGDPERGAAGVAKLKQRKLKERDRIR